MGIDEASESPEAAGELTHEAIREQLDRILAHREFHATDKMRDFLRFVVEETLNGRKHRIKGYTIATRVFGRGDDFDASQDPIVSIQAGRLRRALERYYLIAGGHDPISIDIPKGRYVPRFVVQSAAPNLTRNDDLTAETVQLDPPTGPTIVVLPFEDLTGDPAQQYLAVGLTDDLATELGRFQDLVVVSCKSATHNPDAASDPSELAAAAGARFILQGTVRKDPETVKVSTQLTDVADGRQIWAEAYTHPLEAGRLFATQEEIARSVVAAIGSEYGIIARRLSAEARKKPPAELDTYEALLRYYAHQISPSVESIQQCFTALERAAEREPEYGPVWSALATLHCQMYAVDAPGFEESLDTALRFARRGVLREPGSQLGRLILAYASYLADDSESFHEEIGTALTLNPNSPYTVGTAGYFHIMRGEFDRGLPLLDRAIAANPCHPNWFHGGYVINYLRQQEYDLALLEVQNHSPYLSYWLPAAFAAILGSVGRIDEAKTYLEQVKEQKPDFGSRAHELFRRTLKIEPIIVDLIDGLRLAGMAIER
jgi:TolB-like protein